MADPQQPTQPVNLMPVQVKQKTKTSLMNLVAVALVVTVAATVFGGFGAVASYSAVVGSDIFKVAAGKGGGGGGGKGGGPNKPSLQVSLSNEVTNQTVVAGTKNHTFTKIVLDASALTQNIQVTEINFNVTTSGQISPSDVWNSSIYDGITQLSTTNNPDAETAGKTTDGDSAVATFTFVTPVVITSGSSRVLVFKGNIRTSVINGVYQVGIQQPPKRSKVKVVDATTLNGKKISINYQYGSGPVHTVVSTGSLSITQHGDTPDTGFIPGDTLSVTLATLLIEAQFEDIKIEKIRFTATPVNGGGWEQVDAFHVYNGNTLIGSPTVTSTDSTGDMVLLNITNNPITVPSGETITLTLKADTATVDYKNNNKGESFEGLTIKINAPGDVIAKGAESGDSITATLSNATGNAQYLVRSFPTVTLNETGGQIAGGTQTYDLHEFTITADSSADIGLFSVSYAINTMTVTTTNVFLYEGGAKVATALSTVISSSAGQSEIATFVLTTDGLVAEAHPATNVLPSKGIINAGSSRTYTLRADVECNTINCNSPVNSTGGAISVKFLGDGEAVGTAPTKASNLISDYDKYQYEYSFLWSDFWRTPTQQRSSTTATATEQWLNGYLVQQANGNGLEATSTGANWTR